MPFLLRLDIRRQDEGCPPATYVMIGTKDYDLTCEFAWSSPTVQTDKHTIGHITCHARLLAKCLLASIGNNLTLMLLNKIPQAYRNDGTYMLRAIKNNIHCNNIAFIECIREKIATATLAQHDSDIEHYLIFLKNNLRMIMVKPADGKKFRGLITYILGQLKRTTNSIFLRFVQDLHVQYQEGNFPSITL